MAGQEGAASNAISGTELLAQTSESNFYHRHFTCRMSHQMLCDISSHVTRQSNAISETELLAQTSDSNCYHR